MLTRSSSMADEDPALTRSAVAFAEEVAGLLAITVCENPAIRAEAVGNRVRVASMDGDAQEIGMPLTIGGAHRLSLFVSYWCTWDFTGQFLAVHSSRFALALPEVNEPLIRVEYAGTRDYAPSHVQVHAHSNYIAHLMGFKPGRRKVPNVYDLHLPTGGKRFRPCLEDVVEFAIQDLGVEARPEWAEAVAAGRKRWRRIQLAAAIRDAIKDDPVAAPDELRAMIEHARADVDRGPRPPG